MVARPFNPIHTMNPPAITFPATPTELKVRRTHSARASAFTEASALLASEITAHALQQDMAALREREDNLRAYEARLREFQARLDQAHGAPVMSRPNFAPLVPFPTEARSEGALHAAWEKLHRARELLEVEQKHLVDDRLVLQENERVLKQREAALSAREAKIAAREQALPAPAKPKPKKAPSTMETLTRAPFAMAKSVFGAKA